MIIFYILSIKKTWFFFQHNFLRESAAKEKFNLHEICGQMREVVRTGALHRVLIPGKDEVT